MTRRLGGTRQTQLCSVLVVFLVHGVEGGAYTVLVADLARALELSDSALGVALAILSASSAVGILPAGRIADRLGRRLLLAAGALGVGCFYGALAFVDSYQVLLVVLVFGGLSFSLLDLSPPTLGTDYERRYGREAMMGLYAGLDAAGAVGAFASGLALSLGVSYRLIYLVLAVLLCSLALASCLMPLPTNLPTAPPGQYRPRRVEVDRPLVAKAVMLAATLVGLVSLLDIALEGYSSRYLRDVLESGPLLAGGAIAGSFVVSGLARLGCSIALRRFDRSHVLVVAGLGMAVGTTLLVVTVLPAVAAVGLLALRAFESPVAPLAYSVAAQSTPTRSGEANSITWVARYSAFLIGPLAVGFIGDHAGLRVALSLFILTSLAIAALAYVNRAILRRP